MTFDFGVDLSATDIGLGKLFSKIQGSVYTFFDRDVLPS